MQHSPTHEHYRDMFVFIVNQIVGSELAPPVHVISSLPVLYTKEKLQYAKKTLCLPLIGFCTKYKIDSLIV